jgi:hypothetical protein
MTFPNIHSPSSIEYKWKDITIRNSMDDGYVKTRAKYTRIPAEEIILTWTAMTHEDYDTLKEFYKDDAKCGVNHFDWTDPRTNMVYTVRFLTFGNFIINPGYVSGSLVLQEV